MTDLSSVFRSAFKNVFTECEGCKHYEKHIEMIARESKEPCKYCSRHYYDKFEEDRKMTRKEAIERFNGIINAMSISIAQSKFYPSKAELDELCDMAIESLSTDIVRCKDCRHAEHRKQMPNQIYCKRDKLSTFCAVHDDDDFCKYGERREE